MFFVVLTFNSMVRHHAYVSNIVIMKLDEFQKYSTRVEKIFHLHQLKVYVILQWKDAQPYYSDEPMRNAHYKERKIFRRVQFCPMKISVFDTF